MSFFRSSFKRLVAVTGFGLLTAGAAAAAPAVTSVDLNLRMGPSSKYSRVATIPRHHSVRVHGCLSNYRWCDVSYRGHRGWVFAKYLRSQVRPSYVVAPHHAGFFGFPIINFVKWGYFRDHYPVYYKRHYRAAHRPIVRHHVVAPHHQRHVNRHHVNRHVHRNKRVDHIIVHPRHGGHITVPAQRHHHGIKRQHTHQDVRRYNRDQRERVRRHHAEQAARHAARRVGPGAHDGAR